MTEDEEGLGPEGRPFAVADRVYCAWDVDHQARTLEFLDGVDTEYFASMARVLGERLDSDDDRAVSVALRVLYHQGIETLMSFLGAAAQGAWVVPAWIAKARTEDLQEVARRLGNGQALLTGVGPLPVSFDALSQQIHRYVWTDDAREPSTATQYARFWYLLAGEFLDEDVRAEYNALKHGTRVVPGGFTLAIGLEETYGVAPPPEQMRSLGGSAYGSTFYAIERVGATSWHVSTRRTSLNWLPDLLANRLVLLSMSINNIVGALRCELGVDPALVRFQRPVDPDAFNEVWSRSPGTKKVNLDHIVRISPEDELSREALRDLLQPDPDDQ